MSERVKIIAAGEGTQRPQGGGGYLSDEQKAEISRTGETGFASFQERKIRDLARDLHEGRVPAARPEIRAALAELATEIIKALSAAG